MSLIKFKTGTPDNWISLYVEAIRNRLRRDLNLSDLFDVPAARNNLGLIGDNNTTHFHDSRYIPMLNSLKTELLRKINNLKVKIIGEGTSNTVTLIPESTTSINLQHVNAESLTVERTVNDKNMMMAVTKYGKATPLATEKCYFDAVNNKMFLSNLETQDITANGTIVGNTIRGNRVYNAVWNDYAELFPRGEETDPGDIIALDMYNNKEQYVKANGENTPVGVHTDNFAMLIGGDPPQGNEDLLHANINKYIPVSLAGRVYVKFIGKAVKGAYVVPSSKPGYGRMYDSHKDSILQIIGIILEDDDKDNERKIKIKVK